MINIQMNNFEPPIGKRVKVVLDTDTYNDADDQFALAYLMKSKDLFDIEAIYAAPFTNKKALTPKEGMEKSYQEILKVLDVLGEEDFKKHVYKGSEKFHENETKAVVSPASLDLVERARKQTTDNPLYILAIAAITNIAAALIQAPDIADKIVVVWLGGHALDWENTEEFNMAQDIAGARVLFNSNATLIQFPCMGVVSHLSTTEQEVSYYLKGKNKLCDYLYETVTDQAKLDNQHECWSRIIWDIAVVAWMRGVANDGRIIKKPVPTYDGLYSFTYQRDLYKYIYWVDRDNIFCDMFKTITK